MEIRVNVKLTENEYHLLEKIAQIEKINRLHVMEKIMGGFSNTSIIRLELKDKKGWQIPKVFKIGPKQTIEQEKEQYEKYVRGRIEGKWLPNLGTDEVKVLNDYAYIKYEFFGGRDTTITTFRDFYQRNNYDSIIKILETIFKKIFSNWFLEPRRESVNLYTDLYQRLKSKRNDLERSMPEIIKKFFPIHDNKIVLDGINKNFIHPFHFLDQIKYQHQEGTFVNYSITHGDLNSRNILIDNDNNICIIDFFSTKEDIICRDLAKIEAVIKYELMKFPQDTKEKLSEELLRFEDILTDNIILPEDLPPFTSAELQKAYPCIKFLREIVNKKINETDEKAFWILLFYYSISCLRYDKDCSPEQKALAFISSAMIAHKKLYAPKLQTPHPPPPEEGKSGIPPSSRVIIPPGIIGREKEMRPFFEKFQNQNFIVLEGIGGIGKTFFIKKFLKEQEIEEDYKIFWNEGRNNNNIDIIINSFLEQFGNEEDKKAISNTLSFDAKVEYIISLLNKERYVLIFEDFHVIENNENVSNFVLRLKNGLALSKTLLVTRHRPNFIKLTEEREYIFPLDNMDEEDSFALLKFDLEESDYDPNILNKIFQETKGFPLSLRWHAAMAKKGRPPDVLKGEVEEKLNSILEHNLSPQEKQVLLKISVFRNVFNLEAIKFLLNLPYEPNLEEEELKKILDGLEDWRVLRNDFGTYSLHQVIHDFCYSQLENKEDLHKIAADYYLYLHKSPEDDINNALEAYYHLSLAKEYDRAGRLVCKIADRMLKIGMQNELLDILNKTHSQDKNLMIQLNIYKIRIYRFFLNYQQCWEILTSPLLANCQDNELLAEIEYQKGYILSRRCRYKEAKEKYLLSKDYYEKADNLKGVCQCQYYLGRVYHYQDEFEKAEKLLNESLELAKQIKYSELVCKNIDHLGRIYVDTQKFDLAKAKFEEALRIAQQTNEIRQQHTLELELGKMAYYQRRISDANVHFEKSLNGMERFGDIRGVYYTKHFLAKISAEFELDYTRVLMLYNECIEKFDDIGDRRYVAILWSDMALLFKERKNFSRAIKFFTKAKTVFTEIQMKKRMKKIQSEINEIRSKFANAKVLIFDLDGTLYKNKDLAMAYEIIAYEAIADLKNVSIEEAKRRYIERKNVIKTKFSSSTTYILQELGIDFETWTRENVKRLDPQKYLIRDPKLIELLSLLARKYKLVVLTDNNRIQTERTLSKIGIKEFFESIFTPTETGKVKIDPSLFLEITNKLQCTPQECVSIGDRKEMDIVSAEEIGMLSILVEDMEDVYELSNLFLLS